MRERAVDIGQRAEQTRFAHEQYVQTDQPMSTASSRQVRRLMMDDRLFDSQMRGKYSPLQFDHKMLRHLPLVVI